VRWRADDPHSSDPQQIIVEQAREIERLRDDLRRSEAERQPLRRENEKLKEEPEAARRAASRQAAPFSRETRVAPLLVRAAKRGRRMAAARIGGRRRRSMKSTPRRCPLPAACPRCQGAVRGVRVATQYQEESYHAGTVSAHSLAVARGHYLEWLGRLLERPWSRHLRICRFHQHLIVEFDAIFSVLFDPTLDATNWRAEQALRPAVVTRKMCGGGNRTARGAESQHVLASVLRTVPSCRRVAESVCAGRKPSPRRTCRRTRRPSGGISQLGVSPQVADQTPTNAGLMPPRSWSHCSPHQGPACRPRFASFMR
jgi:hypothetical protein